MQRGKPILSAKDSMKILRYVLIVTIVSILAATVLSLWAFGASEPMPAAESDESDAPVTIVDGVCTVENATQLIWIFQNIGIKTFPASTTIVLANDIDVEGKLPTMKKEFTGTFDGNGKTISGITNPLFASFNGKAKNLTLRGKVDVTAADDEKTATKATSFALTMTNATLENIISYVDVQAKGGLITVGGLVGTATGGCTLTNCRYYGEFSLEWNADKGNVAVGGIIGNIDPDGQKANLDGCWFGGKMTVSGGFNKKEIAIGGIIGRTDFGTAVQNNKSAVNLKNCVNIGEITSTITAGVDYAGGIFGLNGSYLNTIEHCSNKGNVKAVKNAGGILGGITDSTKVINCTNFGEMTAANVGEFCGVGVDANFTMFSSYDFSKSDNKACSTNFTSNSSHMSDATTLESSFTLGGVEYEKYNVATVEKVSGLTVTTLKTHKMFEAFTSIRDDGATQAFRFVIIGNFTCPSNSVTVSIRFLDFNETVIKKYDGILATENGDLDQYLAVTAGGENYFAADGYALFGCVITGVPYGAWDSAVLTITDTKTGEEYLEPVKLQGDRETLTIESLPDLSVLGTVSPIYNCGPGLMSDEKGTTEEDSFLTVISNTTKEKFEAYVDGLTAAGFTFVSKNTVDGDNYYTYSKFGRLLYLYFNARISEIRVIADNSSDALSKISYNYVAKEGEQAQFYQYSINYASHDKEGYDPVDYKEGDGMDCGMMYMIKTADNKIIMIDGGHSSQLSATARKALVNYMREITGTPEKEKVTIAAWYFTHPHGDHVAAARDFLSSQRAAINLESVIFNFPSYQNESLSGDYDGNTFTLKSTINQYYPDVLYHKLHTGEKLSIGGVDMEIVYTHEDAVSTEGKTRLWEMNSASTVMKITIDNKTFMMLGDVYTAGANVIAPMHSKSYLKSDVLQVAHHGYNDMGTLYMRIGAPIALFPNAMTAKDHSTYKTVMGFAKEAYFAHKWTYRFTVENGEIKVTEVPRYDQ